MTTTTPAWYKTEYGDDKTVFGAQDYTKALGVLLGTTKPDTTRKYAATEAGTIIKDHLKSMNWSNVGTGLKTDLEKSDTASYYSSLYGTKNQYDMDDYLSWKAWGRTDKAIWEDVFKGRGRYKSAADWAKLDDDAKKETFNVDLLTAANRPGQTSGLWNKLDLGWRAQWDAAGNTKFPTGPWSGGSTDDDDDDDDSSSTTTTTQADPTTTDIGKGGLTSKSVTSATTGTLGTTASYVKPTDDDIIKNIKKLKTGGGITNPITAGLTPARNVLKSASYKKPVKKVRGTKDLNRKIRFPKT